MKPRAAVLDTYWYFAAERQNIFFKKLHAELPFTNDPILKQYKFCNVYRALDRASQFLLRSVIYNGSNFNPEDILFRIFLFRLFNRNETWVTLEKKVGNINLRDFSPEEYAQAFEAIKTSGVSIYGNAFILCANKHFGFDKKYQNHLALLEYVFIKSDFAQRLLAVKSLKDLFCTLRELPLIGDFMAYQIAIDFNYAEIFSFSENDFTIAGPGARRGIKKCFVDIGHYSEADVIHWMVDNQEKEFQRLGLTFQRLGHRPLHAIDCQGLFCETDKYCRVKFPELASNRIKIKAKYQPHSEELKYFFPPKWQVKI